MAIIPAALIAVSNFAAAGRLVEIQGVAVIGSGVRNVSPCSPT
jgi:hypothetical protein